MAEDGRALITDFGFSFPADPSIPLILRLDGGTLKWMAPELVDGEAASVQSDVWSFGMTALVSLDGSSIVQVRSNAGISRNSSPGRSPSMGNPTWSLRVTL